ncbi:tRNA uridine-5-carboxymethylaminomethyl(34) synthesis GTPase MnmE [Verrucomicrobiaceae bacterium N1E253]|uniref:tRNA modification GTPase MnmE n=1 Tax=Oceaniferula marina TaxID=2748318 RepID=A0A851GGN8_9BACT|nr:tRNA uridine-5-carboxymethylaminomethyl(34) synthesis GTPase MnmE [Oceaniferula marina]NWK56526.1 tRNA uridine-5-carboxymethylaminomethyl(34) synthesis GTPase MnmE [Oceaniferula marina]
MDTTIAAIASAPGMGAVGLIRVSGPEAMACVSRCLPEGRKVEEFAERYATLTRIVDGDGAVIDEALVTSFRGPRSYTGEDSVEIACHGGVLVMRRVLERLLECGVEAAQPGEFSQRAFMNGKMDLTQAEAVMDLISAQTDLAMRAAHEQLQGRLGNQTEALRSELLGIAAHVEAFIDFPEEDIDTDTGVELSKRLLQAAAGVDRLLQTAEQGRVLREGLRTVIFGAPNAGKSSLLNGLLGYERAIVSDIEGTTRDTVEEVLNLKGIPVRLIDTAGVRHTEDVIEQQGVDRTRAQVETADLILEVVDGSQPPALRLSEEEIAGRHHVLVINKSDLGVYAAWQAEQGVAVSCLPGQNLDDLVAAIAHEISLGAGEWGGHAVAINARHQACLKRARQSLLAAEQTLSAGEGAEFISMDLREAMDAVGEIAGRIDTEELLGEIFGSFCIGK